MMERYVILIDLGMVNYIYWLVPVDLLEVFQHL
jgi:hypothetical protein